MKLYSFVPKDKNQNSKNPISKLIIYVLQKIFTQMDIYLFIYLFNFTYF